MIVELKNIHKKFGKQEVLNGIDLELQEGTICGLLGPSGCGKTTLVNIIVGTNSANSGTAVVLGEQFPFTEIRKQIGFMPQTEALYLDLTAQENLRFFGSLYGLSNTEISANIPRVLSLVRLDDQKRKTVNLFSGGMKRRLSLAIALIHNPKLLVLDEPTVGLDPEHRLKLWKAFRLLANEGKCLLITTHVMDEAASCDTIVMLRNGKIISHGKPSLLMQETNTGTLEEAFLKYEIEVEN
ncbi:MAG: ABC transporter ATP-binding protein [Bacteroidales bacterium]|jgi:ABC-2 type transport system ATP-binding protein|nr:ABC transporter ATP-binding protein [Bacteroidales bacterium]